MDKLFTPKRLYAGLLLATTMTLASLPATATDVAVFSGNGKAVIFVMKDGAIHRRP